MLSFTRLAGLRLKMPAGASAEMLASQIERVANDLSALHLKICRQGARLSPSVATHRCHCRRPRALPAISRFTSQLPPLMAIFACAITRGCRLADYRFKMPGRR